MHEEPGGKLNARTDEGAEPHPEQPPSTRHTALSWLGNIVRYLDHGVYNICYQKVARSCVSNINTRHYLDLGRNVTNHP